MSGHDQENSRLIRLALIYFVLIWVALKIIGAIFAFTDLPEWILKWIEVSAYTLFPVVALIVWLIKQKQKKGTPIETAIKPNKDEPEEIKTSLAVLPMNSLSNKALSVFSAGIAEDIINAFSMVPQLRVISRNSTKGDRKVRDLHEIVQRASMKHILEGEVIIEGEYPVIRVRLKEAVREKVLWKKDFESGEQTIFEIMEEIFQTVLQKLNIPLPSESCFKNKTQDFTIYHEYLIARANFNRRQEALLVAKHQYVDLIRKQSDYAPAFAGLASTYNLIGFYEMDQPANVFPEAIVQANRALQFDPKNAEAHCALAFAKTIYSWEWDEAEIEFKNAIQANPGFATANHWYAEYLMAIGRLDEAISRSRRAQSHDPLDLIINTLLGMSYYFKRRYLDTIAEGEKTLSMSENYVPVYLWLGMAYEQSGRYDEAIDIFTRGKELTKGKNTKLIGLLAHAHGSAGNLAAAETELEYLLEKQKESYVSAHTLARTYLGLKDTENALLWLEKAFEERATWLTWINVDPIFDDLRDNPRFLQIIHKMNFPKA